VLGQHRRAVIGGQQYRCRTRLARAPAVLAGTVDIEIVMGVLDHRRTHAARSQLRSTRSISVVLPLPL